MDDQRNLPARFAWGLVIGAALLMAVSQGTRSALGMFVSPINSATGLGLAGISFGFAVSQLAAGIAQPFVGAIADRYGPARMIVAGSLVGAAALALLPFAASGPALVGTLAAVGVAGVGAGSAPTLLAVIARRVPADRRGTASGLVGAGGSAGQLALGPAAQLSIAGVGWIGSLFAMAALTLAALPLARVFRRDAGDRDAAPGAGGGDANGTPAAPPSPATRDDGFGAALRSRSYWLLTGTFFVCGFHVSFLLTHMPGVIESCGLPAGLSGAWLAIVGACNVAGSIVSGRLSQRMPMQRILAALYLGRALGVLAFVAAPKTSGTMLAFAVWMGVTYMATLPPTAGLTASLFGTRHMGKLFGITMLLHQVGAFLGIWLGGVVAESTGGYEAAWWVDAALAVSAAGLATRIAEPRAAARPAFFSRSLRPTP